MTEPFTETWRHVLDNVLPFLPEVLADGENRYRMCSVAETLPAPLSEHFAFECRFGEKGCSVDLILELNPEYRSSFVKKPLAVPFPPGAGEEWEMARDLARCWLDSSSFASRRVGTLFFEFDTARPSPRRNLFAPVLFIGAPDEGLVRGGKTLLSDDFSSLMAMLELLRGVPVSPGHRKKLRLLLEMLPDGRKLVQLGSTRARGRDVTKLLLAIAPEEDPVGYVAKAGFPLAVRELRKTYDEYQKLVRWIFVMLDIDESEVTKIGWECYTGDNEWHPFLEFLRERGLALVEKTEALLQWPGRSIDGEDGYAAPAAWRKTAEEMSRIAGRRIVPVLERRLHHIKIVHDVSGAVTAKAYPTARLRFLGVRR